MQRNGADVRKLRTIRISVTSACDLDCVYCNAVEDAPGGPLLSVEGIVRLAEAAVLAGARTVRLTGGEPLLRDDIEEIVSCVREVAGVDDLALTTNGRRLAARARSLREAGLDRVNIGLPSLVPETYRRMTKGELAETLAGLEAALAAGLSPVRLNVVVIGGMNADGIGGFVELARRKPVEVRFIELMPFADTDDLVPAAEIRKAVREAVAAPVGANALGTPHFSPTAELYRPRGFKGSMGIISPVTEPFCERCDRLRVTSDGRLRPCLSEPGAVDLRALLDAGADSRALAAEFRAAFECKPVRHSGSFSGSMRGIGG